MSVDVARRRRFVRRIGWPLRIGVLVGAALLVAAKVDMEAMRAALHPASWGFLVAAIAANGASVVLKGYAWKAVVDGLPGLRARTRIRDLISPLFVGFLFNTVLAARLGELVKVILAKRRLAVRGEEVSTTVLLGTVLVENLVSTIALVLVVIGVGLVAPLSMEIWIASAVLGIACLTIVIVALLGSPGKHVPPWLSTGPLWARASRAFARLWGAVRESHVGLRNPRQMAAVTLPSIGSWLAQMAGIWFALRAFGLDMVGWGGAGVILVSVTIAQIFPVLPGNIGVFQAAVVVPLTHSYPISSASALAFAFGLQATEVVVGVAIGFLFLMVEGVSFRELRAEAESEAARDTAPAAPAVVADAEAATAAPSREVRT